MAQLADSITRFLCDVNPVNVPPEALQTAANGFTDCVGVMLAAAAEPLTLNLKTHIVAQDRPMDCRLMLSSLRGSAAQATLLGTAAAHALDYDDYAFSNHVSALLVPAILAECDRAPRSGRDMLIAYVAGMEIWGTLMKREPDHLHSKGWHPTGVFGPVGVAAAVAQLRGLNPVQIVNALGLAAANGGGVMDNFGTQAKSYQGARAAEAGVVCVELALAGIDAGPNAIDGSGGLLAALSPSGRADLESPADHLGQKWISEAEGLNIKRHPTVGASQRAIDAAIQLHDDYAPGPENIRRIIARVSEKHAAVMRFHQPGNALEAKFSLEFGVAAGLIQGSVGLAELTDAFVTRDDVQSLMARVVLEIGPDNDPEYPVGAIADSVDVLLVDGQQLESKPVRRFRGHGMNPMNRDELREKFMDCSAAVIGAHTAEPLFDLLQDLGDLPASQGLPTLDLKGFS
ncbi:MAG: MmgE/PrpD family protein [Xanthomonadales bacterium]|nr:MmgE/PrpD family protein [Xanthomonadales bacterium]